ncbi:MAG: hypothetical protein ACYC1C_19590 [Chloroflexota bacterium]
MTASLQSVGSNLRMLQRDNDWLGEHLEYVWERHFPDVPRINPVDIAFAKRWKARLGVIALCEESQTTSIRLNALLSHPIVPDYVTTVTVAHEMVHYAHGFGSPLPRLYEHPHKGNIVEREIQARGLRQEYRHYLDWIDENWDHFYHTQTRPPRHLWLPRKSGEPVRLQTSGGSYEEAAASIGRIRLAAEEENAQEE